MKDLVRWEDLMKLRPSPSMVVALVALFVASVGTAVAGNSKSIKLPANSVGAAQLKPNAVTTPDIAKNAINASKIAPKAVTTPAIAPNAVDTHAIKAGAVGKTKLAPGSVGSGQLEDGSVGSDDLGPNSVIPSKIPPRAITQSKIADDSVGTDQLSNAIPSAAAQNASNTEITPQGPINYFGNWTPLQFGTETFDTGGMHNPADGRYLTAPVSGVYQVNATVTWADDGCDGWRWILLDGRRADNSTLFLPAEGIFNSIPDTDVGRTQTMSGMVKLAAGESVGVIVTMDNAFCPTTEVVGGVSFGAGTSISMNWLAPGPS